MLLDEVGGGTDPVEGGALGAAVIDHFRTRGALVVATTHDDALKSYGATTDGVAVAGVWIQCGDIRADVHACATARPGAASRSKSPGGWGCRLTSLPTPSGADPDASRCWRRTSRASIRSWRPSSAEKQAARDERAALDAERQSLIARESRLAEREAVLKKRLDEKVAERLREARAEVDAVVTRLKSKADALAGEAEKRAKQRTPVLNTGEVGDLRAQAREALGQIESTVLDSSAPAAG